MKKIYILVFLGNFIALVLSLFFTSDLSKVVESTINMPIVIPYWLFNFLVVAILYNLILFIIYTLFNKLSNKKN